MRERACAGRLLLLGLALALGVGRPALAASPHRARQPASVPRATPPATAVPALHGITVSPTAVTLEGPRAERQLLVTGHFTDGVDRDVTQLAQFRSEQPKSAVVSPQGLLQPVGGAPDGDTQIRVRVGALVATVKVTVQGVASRVPHSFIAEVVPVLTRAGCNQGACHGAQHGKGGFKLSLLGYDPRADWENITRADEGRRVMLGTPERSLLLTKPTLGTPHAGGKRFEVTSLEYRVLRNWVADGAPAPRDEGEGELQRLTVLPARRRTDPRSADPAAPSTVAVPQPRGGSRLVRLVPTQRFVALAHVRQGNVERVLDVTRLAQFNSLNPAVAAVEPEGVATVAGRGETAVMVRFRGLATVARVTVPYAAVQGDPPGFQPRNYVDELVARRWKEMGLVPSGPVSDAGFIRRVYLDVLGTLPSPEEVRAFLASSDPDRRARLVDSVLSRPEYADYWTLKWGDLLRNNRDKVGEKGMWSFYNWLRAAFRDNMPMDRFAVELVTAQGSTFTNGPANYFRVASDPAQQAEVTSQVFLGVRLACARCHHHPYEKWSQDDYWRMAAFFARVGLKGSNEFGLFGGEQVVRLNGAGEARNPRTGMQLAPTPLDGAPADDPVDRRRALAAWMTDPANPFFARNLANRYWSYLMGRGLVEPVDDVRVTNPPTHPELLDALARDLVEHRYDVKHLLRVILNSAVYQLSPHPTPANRRDEVFYTKYAVRRLGAEELLDALNFATGSKDKFGNLPLGLRAVQLPDPRIDNYFLDTFGRPGREIVCECERTAEPNMAQALHLMNSDFVQNKVASGTGRLARLLEAGTGDDEIIEELYLATFSRPPTAEERGRARLAVALAPARKEGFEDLLWALLNSREFLLKH